MRNVLMITLSKRWRGPGGEESQGELRVRRRETGIGRLTERMKCGQLHTTKCLRVFTILLLWQDKSWDQFRDATGLLI